MWRFWAFKHRLRLCGNKFQSRELLTHHLCVPVTAVTLAHGARPSPIIRTERQRKFLQELKQPSKPNVDIALYRMIILAEKESDEAT